MKVEIDPSTKVDINSYIVFSIDPEGKYIIGKFCLKDIFDGCMALRVNSNKFFVHYPYYPSLIYGWGMHNQHQLGINDTMEYTITPLPMSSFIQPLQKLCSMQDLTISLGKDGKVYYCGSQPDWGDSNLTMSEFQHGLPDEKIIDIR